MSMLYDCYDPSDPMPEERDPQTCWHGIPIDDHCEGCKCDEVSLVHDLDRPCPACGERWIECTCPIIDPFSDADDVDEEKP